MNTFINNVISITVLFLVIAFVASMIMFYELYSITSTIERDIQTLKQSHAIPQGVSLDQMIELKRKQQCGDLRRLPCLMATGYWR